MPDANDHVLERLDDYVYRVLTTAEAEQVKLHCHECPSCQAALEEARRRRDLLEAVPVVPAPEEQIRSGLNRVVEFERQKWRLRKRVLAVGLAATLVLLAITIPIYLYYENLEPTPYNLEVLGQSSLLADSRGSLRVQLVDYQRGKAVPGVPVDIALRDTHSGAEVRLAHFTTDQEGTGRPRFRLPDWRPGEYELRVTAHTEGRPEVLKEAVNLGRSWKVMLSSDKPVYQPGQTIHLRALTLRRPDLHPVAGQQAVFTITDPRGNVIFKQRGKTSKFGITAADCPLADEIREGAYDLTCTLGDTESKLTVGVKKYVLPKFKVDVRLDQTFYQPGQQVRGTVQADYFFGEPVGGAAVQVKAWVWRGGGSQGQIPPVTTRTDAQGRATFHFPLPALRVPKGDADPDEQPPRPERDRRLKIDVTVTDTAGQKQTRVESRLVTSRPIRVEAIPEAGTLVRGVPNVVYLFARYADGRPAPGVSLFLSGRNRPLITDALGVASFKVNPVLTSLTVAIEAEQDGKVVGKWEIPLTCASSAGSFLVRTDKAVYNGGESLHLVALGSGQGPVFVDLIKDGQTLVTETIELKDGRGEYHFDLPPDLLGTVRLCAYRLTPGHRPVFKTQTLYVRPAGRLRVKAGLDARQYLPGDTARLRFTVTDRRSKPVPGALSLAAVDEAVFQVQSRSPGTEEEFYTLDEDLLGPVQELFPWSPALHRQLSRRDRVRFEKALFARTAESQQTRQNLDSSLEEEDDERPDRERTSHPTTGVPYSLEAASYEAKEQKIEETKEIAQEWIQGVWVAFGVVGSVVGVIFFCLAEPKKLFLTLPWIGLVIGTALVPLIGGCGKKAKYGTKMERAREVWSSSPRLRTPAADDDDREGPPPMQDSNIADTSVRSKGLRPRIRVRKWFPETLLWRPQLITDDKGRASLSLKLADSITTWRLTASAIAADGRLGATHTGIRVFKPFFVDLDLPVALTRGDEVAIPVVVHNHLNKPQKVKVTLKQAAWFKLLGAAAVREMNVGARRVTSTSFRIRVEKVGNHALRVVARGQGEADAVKRPIEVVPDGRRVDQVWSGTLQRPVRVTLTVPRSAVEDSARAFLKIYPSNFSQLVEGLESIFELPHGCFEQTSSTTYPNVLALAYLKQTKKSVPRVEAKARQYIHLGYQRLLTFEVGKGGFSLFGETPADPLLTAYGLMEFQDMAKVHDVDLKLIQRTREWLLKQCGEDGSWSPEGRGAGRFRRSQGEELDRLRTTAYVAWAVFADGRAEENAQKPQSFLRKHKPETISDPYVLALVCNALSAINPKGDEVRPYLKRLDALKKSAPGGKVYWEQPPGGETVFYGGGRSARVETTALAALALLTAKQYPATARKALAWLVCQKDPRGTWHSTQATVLALKALVAGTGKALGGDAARRILLTWDDGTRKTIRIPGHQAEVMKQIDLSRYLRPGARRLRITERSRTGSGYQVALRYHVPAGPPAPKEQLAITVAYDRRKLRVRETVRVTATVTNRKKQPAPMVMLDLPIPGGFQLVRADLDRRVKSGDVARYEVNARSAVVYLYGLKPGRRFELQYRLRAALPVKVAVPAAQVYEYYDPDKQGFSRPSRRGERVQLVVD
jgi:hypothetical protein